MEIFFDGTDPENSKNKRRKGMTDQEFFLKKTRKEWRKEKKEEIYLFPSVEVPILMCSPTVENALGLPPSCDPPFRRTHSYGNLPYNIIIVLTTNQDS
jgi:hypothetical protein